MQGKSKDFFWKKYTQGVNLVGDALLPPSLLEALAKAQQAVTYHNPFEVNNVSPWFVTGQEIKDMTQFPIAVGFFNGDDKFEGQAKKVVKKRHSPKKPSKSFKNYVTIGNPQPPILVEPKTYCDYVLNKLIELKKSIFTQVGSSTPVDVFVKNNKDLGIIDVAITVTGLYKKTFEFKCGFTYEYIMQALGDSTYSVFCDAAKIGHFVMTAYNVYLKQYPYTEWKFDFLDKLFSGFYLGINLTGGESGTTSKA